MSNRNGGTVSDYLLEGEEIHRSVTDFIALIEAKGWLPQVRLKRGVRYWCPCGRHNMTVDLEPMRDERIDFLWERGRDCL